MIPHEAEIIQPSRWLSFRPHRHSPRFAAVVWLGSDDCRLGGAGVGERRSAGDRFLSGLHCLEAVKVTTCMYAKSIEALVLGPKFEPLEPVEDQARETVEVGCAPDLQSEEAPLSCDVRLENPILPLGVPSAYF